MILFKQPVYLLLLFAIIPLIYLRHFSKRSGNTLPYTTSIYPEKPYTPRFIPTRMLHYISLFCYWSGVVIVVLVLANPTITESKRVYTSQGASIIIVLDESPSMGAIDSGQMTRFEIAKTVIRQFIASRSIEAVGLVGFATETLLRIPPTIDYQFFNRQLDSYNLLSLGDSSSLGMGILHGVLHLKNNPGEQKILIVLTDGKENSGEYTAAYAGEIAASYGIAIYTVGIGSKESIPVNLIDGENGKEIRGLISDAYEPEVLQGIAKDTGGAFFTASNLSALQQVFVSIENDNTKRYEYRIISESRALYREYILVLFILFAADLFIRKGLLQETFTW